MKLLKITPPEDYVITDADRKQCLGSGEILPCPFCGESAHSMGRLNREYGNIVYSVTCFNLKCGASVSSCRKQDEAREARAAAISKWNKRAQ